MVLDLGKLAKPDYPLFEPTQYGDWAIKGLVVEKDPNGIGWTDVFVSVYLENDEWRKDKVAKMTLSDVMDEANKQGWILMTSGFMKRLLALEEDAHL